jgi:uncharacterized protein involved in oxidation of intracellular sulfur
MSETKKENILYVISKGAEAPEIVSLAFVHAVGALTMEVEAKVVLMAGAVTLAAKGTAKHVHYGNLKPLEELMADFFSMGGKMYLCTPCYKNRSFDDKADLIEQAQPIAAATYTQMLLDANAVVNY